MTSSEAAAMAGRKDDGRTLPFHHRPSIISHHSNSVPSTPHQHPLDLTGYRSRSPSPSGGLGSHSPRSVASEANATLPTLRKSRPTCRYETNVAFGRRRIPYTIGTDMLERIEEEKIKASLEPHEEDKLTGDMRELYDRLLPSDESVARRKQLVEKLESILQTEWPGNEFKVHVFGSSGNLLCTSDSDVDICVQTPMKTLESMHTLADTLAKHGMERVVCVPSAKVPIVKIWDPELQLASDINVNNTLALQNTRMIKTYIQIDERVRPLAMVVKHWTKQRILNDAALGGTLSSYTWICMILNFLQTRDPPILPSLHKVAEQDPSSVTQPSSDFADDLTKLQGYGKENKETLGQLLFQFFRLYGHIFDYETAVISVRHGRLLTRKEKKWDALSFSKEARDRLCVEEPFNTSRNLGNSADETAFRGIHMEIRRAFDLLAEGQKLDQCCEQYEYPVEEKSSQPLWKKPTPGPKPIISFSSPNNGRGGRGGGSMRGRGGYQQKNNHSYRRASTASYGNGGRPHFLATPPMGISAQDYFARGLENHLVQQYQMLELQQAHLKAQLLAQSHQAQLQAQFQHHATLAAQAHAAHVAGGRVSSMNGSPPKGNLMNGRSSPRASESAPASAAILPGYLYPYPIQYDPTSAPSLPSDGARTNPSSPSLAPSVPTLRRGVHRTSAASDTPASGRSQSQPARGIAPQLPPGYPLPPPPYDPALLSAMQMPPAQLPQAQLPAEQLRQTANVEPSQHHYNPTSGVISNDHGPKEYIGYYVDSPDLVPQQYADYSVPPIPTWNELSQRRRRVSPELPSAALLSSAMRRVSRSPSPLSGSHSRSCSTGLRSAPLPQQSFPPEQRTDRVDSVQSRAPLPSTNGLLIVNGSYPNNLPEQKDRRGDDPGMEPNVAASDDLAPSPTDIPSVPDLYLPHANGSNQQTLYANELLQRHNAAELAGSSASKNQTTNVVPPQTNGLTIVSSKPAQPFPTFVEEPPVASPVVTNGYAVRSVDASPTKSVEQSLPQVAQGLNGITPLDIPKTTKEATQQDISSTGPQMLSPVAEARTPSPTASRASEPKNHPRQKNASNAKTNGAGRNVSQVPPQPKPVNSVKDTPTAEETKGSPVDKHKSPTNTHGGTWQRSNAKRRNKKKGSNAKGGNDGKSQGSGQPIPANESERKGG